MSSAELRRAAEVERAEWGGEQNSRHYGTAAAIHMALADWLDDYAGWLETFPADDASRTEANCPALRLARIINGPP